MATNLNEGFAVHTKAYAGPAVVADLLADGGPAVGMECRWIEVAGSGTLDVTCPDGTEITLPAMPNGHKFLARFTEIRGGTATGVVVYW